MSQLPPSFGPPTLPPPPPGVGGPGVLGSPEEVINASAVRPRIPVLPVLLIMTVFTVLGTFFSEPATDSARVAQWTLAIMMPLVFAGMAAAWAMYQVRRFREELETVERIEAAVRARRFDVATWQIAATLSHPMLSPFNRARALGAYLSTLSHARRFDDASRMVDMMLDEGVPVTMVAPLRALKAYSLLREDRLVDADRAVRDIQKMGREGFIGAVLALAETYRDVRTGHTEELLEAHGKRRSTVAEALGPRVADIDALGAWAAMMRNEDTLAQRLWRRATVLAQVSELTDRYPELAAVARRWMAAAVPPELAAPRMAPVHPPMAGGQPFGTFMPGLPTGAAPPQTGIAGGRVG